MRVVFMGSDLGPITHAASDNGYETIWNDSVAGPGRAAPHSGRGVPLRRRR